MERKPSRFEVRLPPDLEDQAFRMNPSPTSIALGDQRRLDGAPLAALVAFGIATSSSRR